MIAAMVLSFIDVVEGIGCQDHLQNHFNGLMLQRGKDTFQFGHAPKSELLSMY